jgi:hypothetical protein
MWPATRPVSRSFAELLVAVSRRVGGRHHAAERVSGDGRVVDSERVDHRLDVVAVGLERHVPLIGGEPVPAEVGRDDAPSSQVRPDAIQSMSVRPAPCNNRTSGPSPP